MLKFRIIFSSFLFLLLVGMNSHARASVKNSDGVESSANDQQSSENPKGQKPHAVITDLDFFGAFSLVNVQLQWRDLLADLNEEASDSDKSFDPHEIFVEESQFFSLSGEKQVIPTPTAIIVERTKTPSNSAKQSKGQPDSNFTQSEQRASIIAFIQNCGTYPKS